MRRLFLLLVLPLALAACGTTTKEGQAIDTPNARMMVVELAYGKALDSINAEVKAGRLKGQRAAETARLLQAAKAGLDSARAAHAYMEIGRASCRERV